jgi:hypothetical protein
LATIVALFFTTSAQAQSVKYDWKLNTKKDSTTVVSVKRVEAEWNGTTFNYTVYYKAVTTTFDRSVKFTLHFFDADDKYLGNYSVSFVINGKPVGVLHSDVKLEKKPAHAFLQVSFVDTHDPTAFWKEYPAQALDLKKEKFF